MKLQQTTLDQTGIAILEFEDGERTIPLFSIYPVEEAQNIVKDYFPDCIKIKAVYMTNNLMDLMGTKIEDIIHNYREKNDCLPENYMDELLSGFPYIIGREDEVTIYFYS